MDRYVHQGNKYFLYREFDIKHLYFLNAVKRRDIQRPLKMDLTSSSHLFCARRLYRKYNAS